MKLVRSVKLTEVAAVDILPPAMFDMMHLVFWESQNGIETERSRFVVCCLCLGCVVYFRTVYFYPVCLKEQWEQYLLVAQKVRLRQKPPVFDSMVACRIK